MIGRILLSATPLRSLTRMSLPQKAYEALYVRDMFLSQSETHLMGSPVVQSRSFFLLSNPYNHPVPVWHSYANYYYAQRRFQCSGCRSRQAPCFFLFPQLMSSIAARSPIESSKRLAAYTAVDHHVRPQHVVSALTQVRWIIPHCSQIIGIGSGMWLDVGETPEDWINQEVRFNSSLRCWKNRTARRWG